VVVRRNRRRDVDTVAIVGRQVRACDACDLTSSVIIGVSPRTLTCARLSSTLGANHPERPRDRALRKPRQPVRASRAVPGANARTMRRSRGPCPWASLSGVRTHVRGRGDPRVRVLFRAARGRLRPRCAAGNGHARVDRAGRSTCGGYADLLPVSAESPVDLGTGFTPLILADRLAAEIGLGEVW